VLIFASLPASAVTFEPGPPNFRYKWLHFDINELSLAAKMHRNALNRILKLKKKSGIVNPDPATKNSASTDWI